MATLASNIQLLFVGDEISDVQARMERLKNGLCEAQAAEDQVKTRRLTMRRNCSPGTESSHSARNRSTPGEGPVSRSKNSLSALADQSVSSSCYTRNYDVIVNYN